MSENKRIELDHCTAAIEKTDDDGDKYIVVGDGYGPAMLFSREDALELAEWLTDKADWFDE